MDPHQLDSVKVCLVYIYLSVCVSVYLSSWVTPSLFPPLSHSFSVCLSYPLVSSFPLLLFSALLLFSSHLLLFSTLLFLSTLPLVSTHLYSPLHLISGPLEFLIWSSPPLSLSLALPYIATQLVDSIEIHDICTLNVIQKIVFNSPIIRMFCSYKNSYLSNNGNDNYYNQNCINNNDDIEYSYNNGRNITSQSNDKSTGIYRTEQLVDFPHIFVSTVGRNNDQMYVLRMTSIIDQVLTLLESFSW